MIKINQMVDSRDNDTGVTITAPSHLEAVIRTMAESISLKNTTN